MKNHEEMEYLLNLSPHGKGKENEEVHEKDWPINRNIKYFRCCAKKCNQSCASCREPENFYIGATIVRDEVVLARTATLVTVSQMA